LQPLPIAELDALVRRYFFSAELWLPRGVFQPTYFNPPRT